VQLAQLYERRQPGALDCSVLFTVWNGARFVEETLPSVLAQEGVRAEILVSDDCSSDDSLERLRATVMAYEGPHDIVLLRAPVRTEIEHQQLLAERARSDLLIAAHQDDVSYPGRMLALVEAMRQPGVVLATSVADYRQEGAKQTVPPSAKALAKVRRFKTLEPFLYSNYDVLIGSRFAVRADLLRLFPRLEPSYLTCGDDIILGIRAMMLGKIARIARPLLCCGLHEDRWSKRLWDESNPRTVAFGYALRRMTVLQRAVEELARTHGTGRMDAKLYERMLGWITRARSHFAVELVKAREALVLDGYQLSWKAPQSSAETRSGTG
jgi:hypothetical protein